MDVFETLYAAIIGGAAALVIALLYDACSDPDKPRLLDDKPEHEAPEAQDHFRKPVDQAERDQIWGQR